MCEKCLSRTNCQFLATHKNVIVDGCTAFKSEEQYVARIKLEAMKEFAEQLKEKQFEVNDLNEDIFYAVAVEDIDNFVENWVVKQ